MAVLAALMERLGLGGREMTAAGHSKDFVLRVVQPALIGLMDGSVSTLAPVFAVAVASKDARLTFLIVLAAAVGAAITGLATFVGGIMHTLPFLLPDIGLALYLAFAVVGVELLAISYIRYRYFAMSFFMSALQVILGGALVFASGVLIGSA